MTAEIALLNKQAVALAADSAVTFHTQSGVKILPSANKIFTLSKYHPVGVMIYGNADLMGVPWELLIKSYRRHLGSRAFDRLDEYATDFMQYLARADAFFPREAQADYVSRIVQGVFEHLVEQITQSVQQTVEEHGTIGATGVAEIAESVIRMAHERWSMIDYPDSLPHGIAESVSDTYKTVIEEKIGIVFQKLPLSNEARTKLHELAVAFLLKFVPATSDFESGLVIAGYGEQDFFPALRSYRVEGVLLNHVLHTTDRGHDVSEEGAGIVPFAQSEMVHTFMQGVDPTYQSIVETELKAVLEKFAEAATAGSGLKGAAAKAFVTTLRELNSTVVERFNEETLKHRHLHYALPAVRVTEILPKDELAAMAESLVNLTVYRRRMSMADETVGGPVDVAVISKGDGFIWIKRKHYFSPALNPQFLSNYFREEGK
jgi:hypothetical protein